MRASLRHVPLPDFGTPLEQPIIPAEIFRARFARFIDRFRGQGLDALVVYGDREHSANISYLTGFDPRFEEALLIVGPNGDPTILTGPENQGFAKAAALGANVALYPPFGLLGQDRSKTPPLETVLRACGLTTGSAVGIIGWKYFNRQESPTPEQWFETPSYLVDAIRQLAGPSGRVVNAASILMHPSQGMRAVNEIEQLAVFEFAACHTSSAVRRVLTGARPGMREFDAARLLAPMGLPLSCHTMLSAGPRAALGLGSPSSRVIQHGDPIAVAYGVWGALNCRAGWMASDASELPAGIGDYIERLAAPYFATVAEWHEALAIEAPGGALAEIVARRLGDRFFGLFLNPGHLIHNDEWMNTPIYAGSDERLASGQAIQVDIIPATGTPYFTSNVEDGLALLDEAGRLALAEQFPDMWARIQHRREFMSRALGLRLQPEVLPFSNMPAYLTPFFLSPELAMVVER